MKANNGKGNNSLRDNWQTPRWLFDALNSQYNFTFDCCASEFNSKCQSFSYDFEDVAFLADNVISWMNPPFSIAWNMFEHFFKTVKKGVAIYRCDNFETGIWQQVIFQKSSWVFIPDRRVSYDGLDGDGARFPSALIGLNVDSPKNIEGVCLEVKRE